MIESRGIQLEASDTDFNRASATLKDGSVAMSLILIIEDEDHIRENICDILGFEGYEVISANNGSAGIELA